MFSNLVDYLTDIILYRFLGFGLEEYETAFLHYFIFQSLRLLFLCWFVVFIFSLLRTWITHSKIEAWILKKPGWKAYVVAATTGIVIPFPMGTHIPLVIGLLKGGLPLGVVVTCLITIPMLSEFTIIFLNGYFNWLFTAMYIFAVLVISVTTGMLIGRTTTTADLLPEVSPDPTLPEPVFLTFPDRIAHAFTDSARLTASLAIWIMLGVAVGGTIERAATMDWFQTLFIFKPWIGVPLVTLFALPFMLSPVVIIPIASALFDKGIPLGVMMAFMMAITTLSFQDAIMLRRIIPPKIMLRVFALAGICIIILGYIFNL